MFNCTICFQNPVFKMCTGAGTVLNVAVLCTWVQEAWNWNSGLYFSYDGTCHKILLLRNPCGGFPPKLSWWCSRAQPSLLSYSLLYKGTPIEPSRNCTKCSSIANLSTRSMKLELCSVLLAWWYLSKHSFPAWRARAFPLLLSGWGLNIHRYRTILC